MNVTKMVNCAVPSCKNDSRRQTKQNSNVTFHRFPKNEDLLRKWVDALQRPDWEPTIRSFVCSAHFADSAMYFSKSGLRKLVQDALPEISLENIEQSKHKNRRKRKAGNKVVMPYMYVATFDDTRKRDSLKREHSDSVSRSKKDRADTYTPQATDCPMKRKLKKRIINLTKLSKRRRLRCNALYASLNRIRKKVTVMTQTLKDLQQKISMNPELSSALESCGVSTTELFKGLWKKEKSCSPEPQEEEEYFYSEIPNNIESYARNHSPKKEITIYSTSMEGCVRGCSPPDMDVQVSVVKAECSDPEPMFVDMEAMCPVCLTNNVSMISVGQELIAVYEKLASTAALSSGAAAPLSLCSVCVATLQRCRRFADMAHKAEQK